MGIHQGCLVASSNSMFVVKHYNNCFNKSDVQWCLNMSGYFNAVTILVLKAEYCRITGSILWRLMPWFHALSGDYGVGSKGNKTDVEPWQTFGHPRSINPNMINHVPQQSFSKSSMLSVHKAIKISYSYHFPCQGTRNCQKSDVSNHSFVDMVRRLSNTAHPYSKSISIIKMYSTNNIDSWAP